MRNKIIGAGLAVLRATRLHRLVQPLTQGLGAILMFHHVRPFAPVMPGFVPNRLLEITPEFFEAVLLRVQALDLDIVTLDEAVGRVQAAAGGARVRRFVVLSFDDGYRDNRDYALPILRRHNAPFTLFVSTGFADHTARMWWLELEAAMRQARHVELPGQGKLSLVNLSAEERSRIYNILYWHLRSLSEDEMLARIAALATQAGIDPQGFARTLCLDWPELAEVSRDPLCTIGAHTRTHPRLARLDPQQARAEMAESRTIIVAKLCITPQHFAYPVGDPTSAGPREFAIAQDLGFASAVTTRPGMLFAEYAGNLTALPRLSVNGGFQDVDFVEVLLSGVPFAMWNRGRRLNVS